MTNSLIKHPKSLKEIVLKSMEQLTPATFDPERPEEQIADELLATFKNLPFFDIKKYAESSNYLRIAFLVKKGISKFRGQSQCTMYLMGKGHIELNCTLSSWPQHNQRPAKRKAFGPSELIMDLKSFEETLADFLSFSLLAAMNEEELCERFNIKPRDLEN